MKGEKNRYLSILKQKDAELGAVSQLNDDIWNLWNPLFEVTTSETEPKAIRDSVVGALTRACKEGSMILLDFSELSDAKEEDITHILDRLASPGLLPNTALIPVPVVTTSTTEAQIQAFKGFIAKHGKTVAFRLFNELTADISTKISNLVKSLDCDVSKSHMIFDLEDVDEKLSSVLVMAFHAVSEQIPLLGQWSTVTLAGTGFPQIIPVQKDSHDLLPRTEWDLFQKVRGDFSKKVKRLDFGDYAIQHPEPSDFDPEKMTISAKVIYTVSGNWLAYKGSSTKKHGWEQTRALCEKLINRTEFMTHNFSAGDDHIYSRAKGIKGPGNAAIWKRVGFNHHITFVAREAATSL